MEGWSELMDVADWGCCATRAAAAHWQLLVGCSLQLQVEDAGWCRGSRDGCIGERFVAL